MQQSSAFSGTASKACLPQSKEAPAQSTLDDVSTVSEHPASTRGGRGFPGHITNHHGSPAPGRNESVRLRNLRGSALPCSINLPELSALRNQSIPGPSSTNSTNVFFTVTGEDMMRMLPVATPAPVPEAKCCRQAGTNMDLLGVDNRVISSCWSLSDSYLNPL